MFILANFVPHPGPLPVQTGHLLPMSPVCTLPKGEGAVTAKLTLAVRPRQDCCNSVAGTQRLQSRNNDKVLAPLCFQHALRETPCVPRRVCRTPGLSATRSEERRVGKECRSWWAP